MEKVENINAEIKSMNFQDRKKLLSETNVLNWIKYFDKKYTSALAANIYNFFLGMMRVTHA